MELRSHIETFFQATGITIDAFDMQLQDDGYNIHIQTPDSHLLIGIHGKNIDTFRYLLGKIIENITGTFTHVHLEVNDYMKEKDARFFQFLDKKIATVRATGKNISLPNLNSFERKKAHNYIAGLNIQGLSSSSEGAPGNRILHLTYTGEIIHTHIPSNRSSLLDELSEEGIGI